MSTTVIYNGYEILQIFKLMKNLILAVALLFAITNLKAQVFGTAQTLKKGTGNFGILPTIVDNNGTNDFMLFLQGGYGLKSNIDLGIKLGLFADKAYLGADVEFALGKYFSVTTGAHTYDDFGLDATALCTLPLNNSVRITSGLDMDIVFAESQTLEYVWVPLNLEVSLKRNLIFIFEADIDTKLFDTGYNMISAGVQFYF